MYIHAFCFSSGYSSVVAALSSIVKQEGVGALFKGAAPTATRAMALNLGMLGGNSEAKKHLSVAGDHTHLYTPPRIYNKTHLLGLTRARPFSSPVVI